jgi:predicted AlkP superfamily phosphohydrolase/phosphomutase
MILFGGAVWAGSLVLFAHRGTRLAIGWGLLWGLAAGFWLFAPWILNANHLRPMSLVQWTIVDATLALVFIVLGGLLTFVATVPLGAWVLLRRHDFANPSLAYATWAAAWLPLTYLALGGLIEWHSFGRMLRLDAPTIRVAGIWWLATTTLSVALMRRARTRGDGRSNRRYAFALTAFAVLGALLVPARLTTPPLVQAAVAPRLVRRQPGDPPKLLVIGLDGGNWRVLKPAMERGLAPTLAKLEATGVHGDIKALWPPYWSAPAWGAIVTGHSQDEIGVHEDLAATARGLPPFELPLTPTPGLDPLFLVELTLTRTGLIEPMPTPRERLNGTPIWERLQSAGVETAVIRFPFTYPASGQAAYVVSNRVVVDLWDAFGVKKGNQDQLIFPTAASDDLLSIFAESATVDSQALSRVLGHTDWPRPLDSPQDPVAVLKRVIDNGQRMNLVATRLIRQDPGLSAVLLHVAGLDEICHALWQYRFPDDFPADRPAERDIAQLGPAVDRFIQELDRQLGDLIATFPSPPNVLIVADHGEGPSDAYPPWRGWHASPGIFLASGPDIPHRTDALDVSYYDVAPTMLDLVGLEAAPDLRGHSVLRRPR